MCKNLGMDCHVSPSAELWMMPGWKKHWGEEISEAKRDDSMDGLRITFPVLETKMMPSSCSDWISCWSWLVLSLPSSPWNRPRLNLGREIRARRCLASRSTAILPTRWVASSMKGGAVGNTEGAKANSESLSRSSEETWLGTTDTATAEISEKYWLNRGPMASTICFSRSLASSPSAKWSMPVAQRMRGTLARFACTMMEVSQNTISFIAWA